MATTKPLFKTKPVKIDTLAEYLSQIRAQLNLDIKTVSMLTQIKPVYLESLEAGNWDNLPAEVYVRGFLKSLAEIYKIKEEVLIEQYEKEHGFGPRIIKTVEENKVKFSLTPKTVIIAVTLLVFLGGFAYVFSQIRSVLAAPMLELSEPTSDVSIKGNSAVIAGRAEIGADVYINGQSVVTDKNGQFNENLILSPGLNVVEVAVKNKFNKENKLTRRINAEITTAQPESETLPVTVKVEVGPESAWLYMEADGVVVQRGTMLPGSSKTVTAKVDVLLTSANAGATKVIYNGKDLGYLGRSGEVVRNVEFTSVP